MILPHFDLKTLTPEERLEVRGLLKYLTLGQMKQKLRVAALLEGRCSSVPFYQSAAQRNGRIYWIELSEDW